MTIGNKIINNDLLVLSKSNKKHFFKIKTSINNFDNILNYS